MTAQVRQQLDQLAAEAGRKVRLPTYLRIFNNPTMPGVAPWDGGFFGPMSWHGTAEEMKPKVQECKDAGIDHIILETNFWEANPDSANWVRQVEFFAPLIDVAHG
jgi:hypothetical protein